MPALTPDSSLDLLFPASVIPASVRQSLGSEFHARPLASTDHSRSHLQVLQILTSAPVLSPQAYKAQFEDLRSSSDTYYILVFVECSTDRIVASGTVFTERKFLRTTGKVGHIEDIAVDGRMHGKGLGRKLILALEEIARSRGCYKTILDCSKDNIPFYEKCGFEHKEYEMVKYAPVKAKL